MFSNSKIVTLRCPNLKHPVEKFGKGIVSLKNAFQFQNSNTMLPTKMCAKKEVSKSKRNWVKRSFSASISFVKHFCTCYKVQFVSSVSYGLKNFVLCRRYFPLPAKIYTRSRTEILWECFVWKLNRFLWKNMYRILCSNIKQNWFSYSQERNLIAMHTFLSAWTIPRSAS